MELGHRASRADGTGSWSGPPARWTARPPRACQRRVGKGHARKAKRRRKDSKAKNVHRFKPFLNQNRPRGQRTCLAWLLRDPSAVLRNGVGVGGRSSWRGLGCSPGSAAPRAQGGRLPCAYLVLFPERQLLLGLLQLLRPVHHEVDEVDAPGQRDEHQDVGDDPQADGHRAAGRRRPEGSPPARPPSACLSSCGPDLCIGGGATTYTRASRFN